MQRSLGANALGLCCGLICCCRKRRDAILGLGLALAQGFELVRLHLAEVAGKPLRNGGQLASALDLVRAALAAPRFAASAMPWARCSALLGVFSGLCSHGRLSSALAPSSLAVAAALTSRLRSWIRSWATGKQRAWRDVGGRGDALQAGVVRLVSEKPSLETEATTPRGSAANRSEWSISTGAVGVGCDHHALVEVGQIEELGRELERQADAAVRRAHNRVRHRRAARYRSGSGAACAAWGPDS